MPVSDATFVEAPGGFAPRQAVSFGAAGDAAIAVTRATPLPAETIVTASVCVPLAGTSSGAQTVGPFIPELGRPILIALSGSWSGSVQLLRSTDGGATRLPLAPGGIVMGTYTAAGVDAPWIETESGAAFYLSLPASGIAYRVSQ